GFALTVLFAVLGFGIYALILPGIATGAVNALIFSLAGRKQFRIRWHFNFAEIKDYFKIGLYDTGAQLLDYVSYKIDVLLVGRFFGMETLGLYNMGKELALKTMKVISPIINSVATPILAKLQDSAEAVKENYLRILRIVALVNFPVLAAFFVFADPVVVLFLSEKYQGAAPFLRILCFWGMFASVGNPAGNLVIAKGRTDLSFKWTIIRVCCAPLAVFIAAKCFGTPNSVAYSQVVLQLVFFFIYWRILIYPLSGITAGEYCGALSRGFSCAVLSALTALVWHLFFAVTPVFGFASPLPGNHWADLIGGCVVFSGAYFAYSWLLNREMYRFLGHVLKKG
ncbi:MAG: oligosaccharide flippase family protein, partial [Bacteroidales bacterium]|nr:oligosaccharide flippase family protein [Bacteroidales bacterium]